MGGVDDRELVERAQGGDRAALDELLRRHYDRIHAICRRIAGNAADGDDATQQALLAIVRGLRRFDGRSAFSTWSYRVATNACLDELRRRKRRPVPTDLDADADWSSATADPDASVFDERVVVRAEVEAALDRLPEEFRIPVVLRDCGGLDYAQIAEALDLAPGTVRSRISRGRAKLGELLDSGNRNSGDDRQIKRP